MGNLPEFAVSLAMSIGINSLTTQVQRKKFKWTSSMPYRNRYEKSNAGCVRYSFLYLKLVCYMQVYLTQKNWVAYLDSRKSTGSAAINAPHISSEPMNSGHWFCFENSARNVSSQCKAMFEHSKYYNNGDLGACIDSVISFVDHVTRLTWTCFLTFTVYPCYILFLFKAELLYITYLSLTIKAVTTAMITTTTATSTMADLTTTTTGVMTTTQTTAHVCSPTTNNIAGLWSILSVFGV